MPVTGGLAGIFVVFTIANYVTMPEPVGLVTALVNLGLAFSFLFLHLSLRLWGLSPDRAHALGIVIALVVLADSILPLFWMEAPVLSTYLILLVLGGALFFLNWHALATTVAAADAAWYVVFQRAGYSFEWAIFGLSLLTASVLAGLAHGMRMRMHRRYALLHLAEDERRRQLELAADVATQSERRFRSLVEATSEGVLVVDEGRIIDLNPAFARIFGWPVEEIAGRTLAEFLTPESLSRLDLVRFSGTYTPLDAKGLRRDGATIPLQIAVKLAPFQGRFVRLLAIRDLPSSSPPLVGTPRPIVRARSG